MNMLDLIYHHDQWGIRQNHAGRRNNNRLDDLLDKSVIEGSLSPKIVFTLKG